jgi:hypothetical protein
MTNKWRVICPACSAWTTAETFKDAERQFELHLAVVHPNLATSVKPVQIEQSPADARGVRVHG